MSAPVHTVRDEETTVPDQSQQTTSTTAPEVGNPADVTGNDPADATPEAVTANANAASPGEIAQATQTIEGDPVIGTADTSQDMSTSASAPSQPEGDNYDDEDAWPYRSLQHEAKGRDIDASGKREEIIARLRESDANPTGENDPAPEGTTDVPRSAVLAPVVENGGIQKTDFAVEHASVLQGLSDERRAQQLGAIKDRAAQAETVDSDA